MEGRVGGREPGDNNFRAKTTLRVKSPFLPIGSLALLIHWYGITRTGFCRLYWITRCLFCPKARANVCTGDLGEQETGRGSFPASLRLQTERPQSRYPPRCSARAAPWEGLGIRSHRAPLLLLLPLDWVPGPSWGSKNIQLPSFLAQKAKFRGSASNSLSRCGSRIELSPAPPRQVGSRPDARLVRNTPTAVWNPGILRKRPSFKPQRALCFPAKLGNSLLAFLGLIWVKFYHFFYITHLNTIQEISGLLQNYQVPLSVCACVCDFSFFPFPCVL